MSLYWGRTGYMYTILDFGKLLKFLMLDFKSKFTWEASVHHCRLLPTTAAVGEAESSTVEAEAASFNQQAACSSVLFF